MASRQGFEVLQNEFPGASIQPVEVTIAGDAASPAVAQGIENLRAILAGDPAFMGAGTTRTSPDGELTVLSLVVLGEPERRGGAGGRQDPARRLPARGLRRHRAGGRHRRPHHRPDLVRHRLPRHHQRRHRPGSSSSCSACRSCS